MIKIVMKITRITVFIALFFLIGCGSKRYLSTDNQYANNHSSENIIDISEVYRFSRCKCNTNTALAIINGSHEEYRNYHNECIHSSISENKCTEKELTDWLSYAYIMAEIYNDALAAYDFVVIIDELKISNDYIFTDKIIKFLEIASKSNLEDVSFLAARKLYDIYNEGMYGVCRDKEKAKYYDALSISINRSIKR